MVSLARYQTNVVGRCEIKFFVKFLAKFTQIANELVLLFEQRVVLCQISTFIKGTQEWIKGVETFSKLLKFFFRFTFW